MIDHSYEVPGCAAVHAAPAAKTPRLALWACALCVVGVALFGAGTARAAEPVPMAAAAPAAPELQVALSPSPAPGFGHAGQWFASLGTESLVQGIWARGFESTFSVQLEPAAGWFFAEHFFARVALEMQLDQMPKAAQDVGDLRTFALGVAPGVGTAWRLHPKVTMAPLVGAGVGRVWRSVTYSGYRTTVELQASAPFVFDFSDALSFFVAPSYKQLVFNRETFPEASRRATLGGRFGMAMGALAHW